MNRRKVRREPLGTIWEIPDELWRRIEPILQEFWLKKPTGRHVAHWRKMLNAILFRMRSGCQWERLPEWYGPKSTVHYWFQGWVEGDIFEKIWAILVQECDEIGGMQWQWQSADTMLGKAWFGGGKRRARTPPIAGRKGPRSA
jgi:putative transposase